MNSGNLFFLNKLGITASFRDNQIEIISFTPFLVKGEFMFLFLSTVYVAQRDSFFYIPLGALFMEA